MKNLYDSAILEMVKKMQDTFGVSNSLVELGKTMGVAYNSSTAAMVSKMQNTFRVSNSFVELGKTLASSISYKIHKEHMSLASIVGNISPILDFYQQIPINEIAVREDQTIVYGSESINIDSLNDIVQDILVSIGIQKNYLLKVIEEIRKLKKPFLEKVVVWIIIPLLISVFSSFINQSIKYYCNYNFHGNKQIIKNIKKELTKNDIDLRLLRTYRIVSIDELIVRERNRKASKLIGKVYFGQIVKVVAKEKNWSLIEWKGNDETSDLIIRGWVFSRYLNKF